jgi:hypothetical protein
VSLAYLVAQAPLRVDKHKKLVVAAALEDIDIEGPFVLAETQEIENRSVVTEAVACNQARAWALVMAVYSFCYA